MIARGGALFLAVLAVCACAEERPLPQVDYAQVSEKAQVRAISVIELAAKMAASEVLLIDVRDPDEFASARLEGALNAPMTHFDPAVIPREDKRETIFYCRTGERSAEAAERMAQEFGGTVRHLAGGIEAWQDTGRATISQEVEAAAEVPAPPAN